ncbi:MFS transporter [Demequina sp. TMPB413]|uniref:MFS transporter n=2 Tax=unclassified Demequina TaxID=2620311 RepID=UPI00200AD444|nr:MFS transporter [Demequina sp. TMPB413]UPU89470.1 MFS transporter [Demequina sp. TMPB413]
MTAPQSSSGPASDLLEDAGGPSAQDAAQLQRRILRTLVIAQVLSGAGLAAGVTVGALLAADLFQSQAAAGIPALLSTLGAGGAAVIIGATSQRRGRRLGLAWGYGVGAVGAIGVVLASSLASLPLLLGSLVIYGAGSAANLQARYAGADLAEPSERGRAAGVVLVATTLGAVAGPQLADVSGGLVEGWGLTPLSGPFLVAGLAYTVGAVVLAWRLRPDPLLTAMATARASQTAQPDRVRATHVSSGAASPLPHWRRSVVVAVAALVGVQAVMVGVMTMTPVHMVAHGHSLQVSAAVISLHVAAMYLPAPLSGSLVDRWGAPPVFVGAGAVLIGASVVVALAPASSAVAMGVGLILLGFGWSLGVAAGTKVLSVAPPLEVRAKLQGRADFFVAAAGAAGGGISGVIVSASSYALLAWIAAAIAASVALLSLVIRQQGPARHVDPAVQAPSTTNV